MGCSRLLMAALALALPLLAARVHARDVVNFNYAWRFHRGPSPDGDCPGPDSASCQFEPITDYECTNMYNDPDRFGDRDCATACCYSQFSGGEPCLVWQHSTQGRHCLHGGKNATCSPGKSGMSGGQRKQGSTLRTKYQFAAADVPEDESWPIVDAPHDFVIEGNFSSAADWKHGYMPRNVSWYRKHFVVPADWKGSAVQLEFDGVFHVTQVWINGQAVSAHFAGYTEFSVRLDNVSSLAWGGKNVIALRTDASFGSGHWYEGGGIYRQVRLVRTTAAGHFVRSGVFVDPHSDGSTFVAHAEVESFGPGVRDVSVQFTLTTHEGAVLGAAHTPTAALGTDGTLTLSAIASPETKPGVWGLATPTTYVVTATVVSATEGVLDSVNVTVGFRQLMWDPTTGFALNGERFSLRGFSHHNSFAGIGVAVPDRLQLFKVQTSKALGSNIWRMSHNPYLPVLYDFLDEAGVLVWDENRDMGYPYIREMHDMVKAHRNHPSIVIWSLCNEFECEQSNNLTSLGMRAYAKSLDPARPVGANGPASLEALDVQGFSHSSNKTFISFHQEHPDIPTVLSECCSCTSQRTDRSLPTCIQDQNSPGLLEYVAGSLGVWTLFDYIGEPQTWPGVSCNFGQMDLAGFPKPHAYWYTSNWLQETVGGPSVEKSATARILTLAGDSSVNTVVSTGKSELLCDGKSAGTKEGPAGQQVSWTVSPTPGACAFARNLSGVQCKGLTHSKNSESAAACEKACCDSATFCAIWQFDSDEGCWIGQGECGPEKNGSSWVGGGRVGCEHLQLNAIDGQSVAATHTITAPGTPSKLKASVDVPSPTTGTGSALILDGLDMAMVGVAACDANGVVTTGAATNVTFSIVSGPGRVVGVGNGNPSSHVFPQGDTVDTYMGWTRVYVQVTEDCMSAHRDLIVAIDVDSGKRTRVQTGGCDTNTPITIKACSAELGCVTTSVPVSGASADSPLAVARDTKMLKGYTYVRNFDG